jgi:hypothetical protein
MSQNALLITVTTGAVRIVSFLVERIFISLFAREKVFAREKDFWTGNCSRL